MLKVGLTGSIAVGKSFVLEIFRELGAFGLDEVVAKGTKGLRMIVEYFGAEVLLPNGELDRIKLGAIIFADEAKRQLLNSIVHPLVHDAQSDWLIERERENPDGIAIIDAALMIESGGYRRFKYLIVVFCEPALQLERLILRNNLSETEALKRINSQMPQEEKKKYADFLIDTSNGFEDTKQQTIEIYERLKLIKTGKENETTDEHG